MQINKIVSSLIILTLFGGFCIFELIQNSEKAVVKIISPTIVELKNETICIPDVETFTSNVFQNQKDLEKKYKINPQDALKLGYLTDNFAENFLLDKSVKIKYTGQETQDCKFADLYVNKQSYKEHLINSGFDLRGEFSYNLKKAQKLNLVILNHKSNKYHKLDCKYGLVAHDAVLLPEKQLSKNAKPCKFCHVKQTNKHTKKLKQLEIPNYPQAISNGNIKMYLTDLTTKLKPDKKCSSVACKEILNQINSSKSSIDIALYGWDNIEEIQNAIINAKKRNVRLRVVYDTSEKSYYPNIHTIVKLADVSSTDTPKILMHNKFMIFDNKTVATGSMNFSFTDFSGFNTNSLFIINSPEIASIYEEEFEQMLNGKFHQAKSKVKHKTITIGKTNITPLFSPKDKIITTHIIPLIEKSSKYIYIPAFVITHDEFAQSLLRAKNRGVDVKIIIDATNTHASRSKVKYLRNSGLPIKVENYAGKVHSKSIIIDDRYVVAGSMNFSNSGENKNDENVLIIEDSRLASYYKGFFNYLWTKIPDKYLKQGVRAEGKYSIGSCSDGIDNNFDGKVDKDDIGCR